MSRTKNLTLFAAVLGLMALGIPAASQGSGTASPAPLTPDRLQQMVAPIALYPDSLVSQILIACTFPTQVVQAYQWSQKNKDLTGAKAQEAVQSKPWDPSVQSLVPFPQILERMYQGLDWMEDLGQAFLDQQKDVMDAIQVMRQKAQAAGNLKTSTQQTVTQQGTTIIIVPADPQVVYVPAYNPTVIYGVWAPAMWYYPPAVYAPWPGYYPGAGAMAFGVGVAMGAAWSNAYNCNWAHGNVYVNNNYYHGSYNGGGTVHGANGNVSHYGNTTAAYNKNTGQVNTYNSATGNTRSGQAYQGANGSGVSGSNGSAAHAGNTTATYNKNTGQVNSYNSATGNTRSGNANNAGSQSYSGSGASGQKGGQGAGGGSQKSASGFQGMSGGASEQKASDRGWNSRSGTASGQGGASKGGASASSMNRGGGFSGGGASGGGGKSGGGGRRR